MNDTVAPRDSYGTQWAGAWNRFWFTPTSPLPLCGLRVGVGAATLLYLTLWTGDLSTWLSPDGLLSAELYHRYIGSASSINRFAYASIFHRVNSPAALMAIHAGCLAIAALFTAGVFTRITSVATLVALLQYIHRAPLVMGQAEPVLTMLLLYLCVSPCGAALSVDAWRKTGAWLPTLAPDWTATVGLRLIQVHLCGLMMMMGLAKFQGEIWWRGEGLWAMMAMTRSRTFDWSSVRNLGYLLNLWTLAQVWYEVTFAALIWPRLTRPIILIAGVILWPLLFVVSGLSVYCLTMLVATSAFVPAERWKK